MGAITPGMQTLESVKTVLARIATKPSCVDMMWRWQVVEIEDAGHHLQEPDNTGFLIRTTFARPDRDPPHAVQRGFGGWHHVPSDASDSAIVKRAFVAMMAILQHELMEAFHYDGDRLFDPHHTIDDLGEACRSAALRRGR